MMSMPEVDPATADQFMEWAMSGGHVVKVLYRQGGDDGMSLVWSWFGPGYSLPRHSHDADCLYFVVSGEARLGNRTVPAGGGFFVPADAPYAYTAGNEGIQIAVLALNYFGVSPLPERLVQVPLEYVDAAAGWLYRQPGVRDTPVILVGGSKGAELALSVAAHLPARFGAVVAVAPSCVVWAGVEFVAKDRRFLAGLFGTASRRSSWSLRGDPLPFRSAEP